MVTGRNKHKGLLNTNFNPSFLKDDTTNISFFTCNAQKY